MPYWALVVFLVLAFLTGGGSRADIQSLVILRPAAVLFLAYGLWGLKWQDVRAYRFLFALAAAVFALVLLHLLPLPPSFWKSLPGRELAAETDDLVALGEIWRPISLVPAGTWNALFSLFVPLAALVLMARLEREARFKLLIPLLVLGVTSAIWGFLQAIGPANGPLYLYRITNLWSAVGLFANRNHQAVLLAILFPMLAVYASTGLHSVEQARGRKIAAISIGIILAPLILVTGSRAGLLTALIGLAAIPALYEAPDFRTPEKRGRKKIAPKYVLGMVFIAVLALTSAAFSRAEALSRVFGLGKGEELRFAVWEPIAKMTLKYFPVGSGVGSFPEIYQVDEPQKLLTDSYLNHAHNDWLEVAMTAGFPGIALLAAGAIAWVLVSVHMVRQGLGKSRELIFARLGAVIVLIFAIASLVDYPTRVPSLSCLFIIAAVWMAGGGKPDRVRSPGGRETY